MLNIPKCCFSVQQDQQGKVHYAFGAGQHAGLSLVLDTKQAEYFAPLQPLAGIWVRHIQTVMPSSVKRLLALSEEHRLIMIKNRVLRKTFKRKRVEIIEGWQKLHDVEFHGFLSLPDIISGPGSSVSIATRYRLDGPEIESPGGLDFPHPPRPAHEPTQHPMQQVPGLSRG